MTDGCTVGGKLDYSILFENVTVEEGAEIGADPAVVGADGWGITVIGNDLTVGKNAKVSANKMITDSVKEGEQL